MLECAVEPRNASRRVLQLEDLAANDPRTVEVRALIEAFCRVDAGRSVAVSFRQAQTGERVVLDFSGDTPRPVASVIKVALVMALYDMAHAGLISLDEHIAVNSLGATRYVSLMRAFDRNRKLSLRELAAIALITSDNPIAVMLEERVGYGAVNEVLRRASQREDATMTVGFREHELGPMNRANQLSANETLELFHQLAADARYGHILNALENNLRNNRIPALMPDEVIIAHKTGSLAGVVNDAGLVRIGLQSFGVVFLCDAQEDPAATSHDIAVCSHGLMECLLLSDAE